MMLRRCVLSVILTSLLIFSAAAQNGYPARPIRMLYGFPPGTDMGARNLAEKLADRLGRPVIFENVAGASGNIAADQVARAEPDGYTVGLLTGANIVLRPLLESIRVSARVTIPTPQARARSRGRQRPGAPAGSPAGGSPEGPGSPRAAGLRARTAARREERWHRPHGDLDREVGRAPHDVDDPECRPESPAASHTFSNAVAVSALPTHPRAGTVRRIAYRMKLAAWPRAFAARSSSASSAPIRSSSSSSSRRWVPIISGPSVAIVKATPWSTNARKVVADRVLVGERLRQQVRGGADLEHRRRLAQAAPSGRGLPRQGSRGRCDPAAGARRPRGSPRRRSRLPRRRGS